MSATGRATTAPVRTPVADIAALADRRLVPDGPPDAELAAVVAPFLLAEARLLDQRRFEEWLEHWSPTGLFWMPLDPDRAEDPTYHQALTLDDRVRLGERVQRLRSKAGWSQVPATRTLRHVGAVEAWVDGDAVEARSVLTLHFHRDGHTAVLGARQEHRLRPAPDGGWVIDLKVLDLLDPDAAQPNLSFLF